MLFSAKKAVDKHKRTSEDASASSGGKPSDQKEVMQEKTFRKWINEHYEEWGVSSVTDVFSEFRDGSKLLTMLEVLTSQKLPREKGSKRSHHISNINRALQFLQEHGTRVSSLSAEEIADGNPKAILNVVWHIMQYFWKTTILSEIPGQLENLGIEELLKHWCRSATRNYEHCHIKNFVSSFADGYVFNAIIHNFNPQLFNYNSVLGMSAAARLSHAFHLADMHLHVPVMLEVDDVCSAYCDRRSIITYVVSLFQRLPHAQLENFEHSDSERSVSPASSAEEVAAASASTSGSSSSAMSVFRSKLETVLAGLLDASEKLNSFEPVCTDDLDVLKAQYMEHQQFINALTQYQSTVGGTLQEGKQLSLKLSADQVGILEKQLEVLQDKWDALRVRSTDRQTVLQSALFTSQLAQVNRVAATVAEFEHAIDRAEPSADEPSALRNQIEWHKRFQRSLAHHQESMNNLQKLVIPDGSQSEPEMMELQAKLKDISRSWRMICTWEESRWSRLSQLQSVLSMFCSDEQYFKDWCDAKEEAVSALQSLHGSEFAESISRLTTDIEGHRKRFEAFRSSGEHVATILDQDNVVGARALRQRLAEYAQRYGLISAAVSENASKKSKRSYNQMEQGQIRVDQIPAGDLRNQLQRFESWLNATDSLLYGGEASAKLARLSYDEQRGVMLETDDDVRTHETALSKLIEACRQVAEVEGQDEAVRDALDSAVVILETRFRSTQGAVSARLKRVETMQSLTKDMRRLAASIRDLGEWADNLRPESIAEYATLRHALAQCTQKLEIVKQLEPQVNDVRRRYESICSDGADHCANLQREAESFTTQWTRVVDKVGNAFEAVNNALGGAAPTTTYMQALHELADWTETARSMVDDTPDLLAVTHIDTMQGKLDKLRSFQNEMSEMQESLGFVEQTSRQLEDENSPDAAQVATELQHIKTTWSKITANLQSSIEAITTSLRQLQDLDTRSTELERWMSEVTLFLEESSGSTSDVETLREQLHQCKGLVEDIRMLQPKLDKMTENSNVLADKALPAFADCIRQRMETVLTRWNKVCKDTEEKNKYLQKAFSLSVKVVEDIERLRQRLTEIEEEMASLYAPESGRELQSMVKRHKSMRDELDAEATTCEAALRIGVQMVAASRSDAAPADAVDEADVESDTDMESLQEQHKLLGRPDGRLSPDSAARLEEAITILQAQWKSVGDNVAVGLGKYTEAWEAWKEFQELLATERICMDQLERKLAEPMKTAADAEEFSEQLDLLERLMEGTGNNARLNAIAEQLMSQDIIRDTVNSEINKYNERRSKLMEPAAARRSFLESGVTDSQEYEQQLLECQKWVNNAVYILTSRLESDILAADVPEQYKLLQDEFTEQEINIGRLEDQVENYKQQGKEHAAQRLSEQIDHLKHQIADARIKLAKFGRPADLEQRLERTERILVDTEAAAEILRAHSDNPEDILELSETAKKISDTISELKPEIDYLLRTGNKLLEQSPEDTHLPENLRQRLDHVKQSYPKLGLKVADAKDNLENAEEAATKLHKKEDEILGFLKQTEMELDRWSADKPSGSLDEEFAFVRSAQQHIVRQESDLAFLEQECKRFVSLVDSDVATETQVRVDKTRQRWTDLQQRLRDWDESLKNIKAEAEELERSFVANTDTLRSWLDSTQTALHELKQAVEQNQQLHVSQEKLQLLRDQQKEQKARLQLLRDSALQLTATSEVESPHMTNLAELDKNWELVDSQLQAVNEELQRKVSENMPVPEPREVPKLLVTHASKVGTGLARPLMRGEATDAGETEAEAEAQPEPSELIKHIEEEVNVAFEELKHIRTEYNKPVHTVDDWNTRIKHIGSLRDALQDRLCSLREQCGQQGEKPDPAEVLHAQMLMAGVEEAYSEMNRTIEAEMHRHTPISADYELYVRECEQLIGWCNDAAKRVDDNRSNAERVKEISDEQRKRQEQYDLLSATSKMLHGTVPSGEAQAEKPETEEEKVFCRLRRKWSQLTAQFDVLLTDAQETTIAADPIAEDVEQPAVEEVMKDSTMENTYGTQTVPSVVDDLYAEAARVKAAMLELKSRIDAAEGKETKFMSFSDREDKLLKIKENLSALAKMVEQFDVRWQKELPPTADAVEGDRQTMQKLTAKLRDYWQQVDQAGRDKQNQYILQSEIWAQYHTDLQILSNWADSAEQRLRELPGRIVEGGDVQSAEEVVKQLNVELGEYDEQYKGLISSSKQLLQHLQEPESTLLVERHAQLDLKMQQLHVELHDRSNRLEENRAQASAFREEVDDLTFWLDETEALTATEPVSTNVAAIDEMTKRCGDRQQEVAAKQKFLAEITETAARILNSPRIPKELKEPLEQEMAGLNDRLGKVDTLLLSKIDNLRKTKEISTEFEVLCQDLADWVAELKQGLEKYNQAVLYTPVKIDPSHIDQRLRSRHEDMDRLSDLWSLLSETADDEAKERVRTLLDDWGVALQLATQLRSAGDDGSTTEATTDVDEHRAVAEVHKPPVIKRKPRPSPTAHEPVDGDEGDEEMSPEPTQRHMGDAGAGTTKQHHATAAQLPAKTTPVEPRQQQQPVQPVSPLTQAFEAEPSPSLSELGRQQMHVMLNLKHWLTEALREISDSVAVANQEEIKHEIMAVLSFESQLKDRQAKLVGLLADAMESEVQHKAELLHREWQQILSEMTARRGVLNQMLEDVRPWDNLRATLVHWVDESDANIAGNRRHVGECTMEELRADLRRVETVAAELDVYRQKMNEFSERSNRLIECYVQDDCVQISQTISSIGAHWARLNDTLRIRKAILNASLRGRQDFTNALSAFCDWVDDIEERLQQLDQQCSNTQLLKDTLNRATWIESSEDMGAELTAHKEVYASLQATGQRLLESMQSPTTEPGKVMPPSELGDRDGVSMTMEDVARRWKELGEKHIEVSTRLRDAQEQWEKLTVNLSRLINWVEEQDDLLVAQAPVGGDLTAANEQLTYLKDLDKCIETQGPIIRDHIELARSFLLQQDLRSQSDSYSSYQEEDEDDPRIVTRKIAMQIKAESDTLETLWNEFSEKKAKWRSQVDHSHKKWCTYDNGFNECDADLTDAEEKRKAWTAVKDVKLEDLQRQLDQAKTFERQLAPIKIKVDAVNDQSARLLAERISLSENAASLLTSLNQRYHILAAAVEKRVASLQNALRDFGPTSQHFLEGSVTPPWERHVSETNCPYFLNTVSDQNTFDHPEMTLLMDQLCTYNDVKFSAYRTAIKLRVAQKRLCLDLLSLHEVVRIFEQHHLTNEASMTTGDVVLSLLTIYEHLLRDQPDLMNPNLASQIDLCLNWLLNTYDPNRTGAIRVLSFKIAIVLLCSAHLEEKYKYLFRQVCSSGSGVDQKKLALLVHDCLQIPKYFGEVAAFGGTNVEPSVRSCFEQANYPQEVSLGHFLSWLKCEPQSVVWLPVMHRIAAAETAKHQAKCNVCKMFPIVGLRYRCLRCFNFDMCQNCFFSQRKAKGHKLSHPIQEYCVASTGTEDVRDFSRVVRNKLKSKNYLRRHQTLGYLPVQSVLEGTPIEVRQDVPANPDTADIHCRLEQFATRLLTLEQNGSRAESNGSFRMTTPGRATLSSEDDVSTDHEEHHAIAAYTNALKTSGHVHSSTQRLQNGIGAFTLPKSPAQIISAIDGMQKEELEAMVVQLEEENRKLQEEYEQLHGMQNTVANGNGVHHMNGTHSLGRNAHQQQPQRGTLNRAVSDTEDQELAAFISEEQLLAEARALRKHKLQLEARMNVLEEHNRQLEAQLMRLRQIIDESTATDAASSNDMTSPHPERAGGGYLDSPAMTASLVQPEPFGSVGLLSDMDSAHTRAMAGDDMVDRTAAQLSDLMSMAEDLGRAMGSYVTAVTSDVGEDYDDDVVGENGYHKESI